MSFAKRYRLYFFIASSSTILLALFSILTPYILIDTVDEYMISKDKAGLLHYSLLMLGILLIEVLLQFVFIYYANWVGQHIIRDMRAHIFRHILKFKMSYFDKSAIGRLVTRAVNDVETIASIFSQGLFMIIADFLKMGLVIIVMLVVNWKLSLIAIIMIPIAGMASKTLGKRMGKVVTEAQEKSGFLNTHLIELFKNHKLVKIFQREEYESKRTDEHLDQLKDKNIKIL